MKRYEHYLYPPKSASWPGAVLCLSSRVRWESWPDAPDREYILMEQWDAALCVQAGGGYAVARRAVGSDSESFWRTLKTATLRCNSLWVICANTRQSAVALGLWERLESGHVHFDGSDWRTKSVRDNAVPTVRKPNRRYMGSESAGMGASRLSDMPESVDASQGLTARRNTSARHSNSGIVVLQDPPIILELRIGGGGCKVTWVDAANYGINPSGLDKSDTVGAGALAEWFISAASTLQSLGRCGWQATAGSQAMHLFRSVYHKTPILSHTERHATVLERDGLFGGRCEVYQYGRIAGPVHLYDIRSMYPYLCTTVPTPVSLAYVYQNPSVDKLVSDCGKGYCGIARVDIETDEPDYPYRLTQWDDIAVGGQHVRAGKALPREARVIYPVGRYTTVLGAAELLHALRAGRVRRVRLAALYNCSNALRQYQEQLYAARCRSDNGRNDNLSAWIKALQVSLPGKFAQQDCRWVDLPNAELPTAWGEYYWISPANELVRYRSIAGRVQIEEKGGFSYGAVPAISVSICAAGRSRLLSVINAAGRESVHYCDTDAIICDDAGRDSLTRAGFIRPGEWGYLQHVVSADWCEIYGVKRYRIGVRVRAAGGGVQREIFCVESDGAKSLPPIGVTIRARQRPAGWRETSALGHRTPIVDDAHSQGTRVQPIRINRWDGEQTSSESDIPF